VVEYLSVTERESRVQEENIPPNNIKTSQGLDLNRTFFVCFIRYYISTKIEYKNTKMVENLFFLVKK